MDAIIGRYRVRMEAYGLTLKHEAGINFDLTPEETLILFNFINIYREALLALQQDDQPETEPRFESVVIPTRGLGTGGTKSRNKRLCAKASGAR